MSAVSIGKKLFLSVPVEKVQVGGLSTSQTKKKDTPMKTLMNLKDNSFENDISFNSTEGSQEPEEEAEEEENKEPKTEFLRLKE